MKCAPLVLPTLALLLASAGPVRASLLYNNGSISYQYGGIEIAGGFAVSNSFTISQDAHLTGAQIGLMVYSGSQPTSVQWAIGASPFSSDFGSGTVTLTNLFYGNVNPLFDAYQSTFPLSGALGAGQYWLTLQNALSTNTMAPHWTVYWTESRGRSLAQLDGSGISTAKILSESFQIYGTTTVPEPASLTLFGIGIGITGLAGYGWRRRK